MIVFRPWGFEDVHFRTRSSDEVSILARAQMKHYGLNDCLSLSSGF
jgi:hypothetical protein